MLLSSHMFFMWIFFTLPKMSRRASLRHQGRYPRFKVFCNMDFEIGDLPGGGLRGWQCSEANFVCEVQRIDKSYNIKGENKGENNYSILKVKTIIQY